MVKSFMARLFLDVDGVINASMPQGWGKTQVGMARGFRIHWAPAMIKALFDAKMSLTWATTWREYAPAEIAPLIGRGRNAEWLNPSDETRMMDWSIYWKFDAMQAEEISEPFVWIDDEITEVHVNSARDNGGFAFAPNPRTGISPMDIIKINAYLEENK